MQSARAPLEHAIAFLEGGQDDEDLGWLRRGFALAFRDGVTLEQALGLPNTGWRRRQALRDFWIREALAECVATLPWPQAEELARAGRAFERLQWPLWRQRETPPSDAPKRDRILFHMYRVGGKIPTARQLYNVLTAAIPVTVAVASTSSVEPAWRMLEAVSFQRELNDK
jgi:hypothetical protein